MARQRSSGGSAGLIWAVVLMAFGFVICLVLAIVFATQIKAAQEGQQRAESTLQRFVTADDQRDPAIVEMAGGAESVVAQLRKEIGQLKQLITGSANATIDTIKSEMQSLGLASGETLMLQIRRLRAEEASDKETIAERQKAYEAARKSADDAETARNRVETAYRESVEKLKGELEALKKAQKDYEAKVADAQKTLEQKMTDLRGQLKSTREEGEDKITSLKAVVDEREARIKTLEARNKSPLGGQVDPSLLPDGQIESILADQGRVYINVGLDKRLIPGITFEVFSRKVGVETDKTGVVRGKATIEVTNVFDTYSVARVVRLEQRSEIFEGDIIANVVYDPNMALKFLVHGKFDIDNIGQAQERDRVAIMEMIRRWGGSVVDKQEPTTAGGAVLPPDLDFLVLGEAPPAPKPLSDREVDPLKIAEHAAAMRAYNEYSELVAEAKKLSIPVLNQNRFLTMVGYYRR